MFRNVPKNSLSPSKRHFFSIIVLYFRISLDSTEQQRTCSISQIVHQSQTQLIVENEKYLYLRFYYIFLLVLKIHSLWPYVVYCGYSIFLDDEQHDMMCTKG